ncbi:hypothetical protein O4159_23800 [Gordonia terrae]|uniref:hypothetical protein n=1 Tax=Gordonia hongkongensis TaxID=1701090 RepID=UPI0022B44D23|nr:hypothetical protein [Gordonia terrae]
MTLDRPLGVGATGTHGTIIAYEYGKLIRFRFPSGTGVCGTHAFTVDDAGQGWLRVGHEVVAEAGLATWLVWKAVIEPAHDTVLEQLLDRLQAAVDRLPANPVVPSVYARLLRRFD